MQTIISHRTEQQITWILTRGQWIRISSKTKLFEWNHFINYSQKKPNKSVSGFANYYFCDNRTE